MNLLVVSSWLPYPPDNGSRVRAYHLLKHLARRHVVTLLSFGLPEGQEDLSPLREFCSRVEIAAPMVVKRLTWRGLLSPIPRHFVQTRSAAMAALVSRHIAGHTAALGFQIDAARYLGDQSGIAKVFEEVEVAVLREQCRNERHPLRRVRNAMTWGKTRQFVRHLVQRFERATVVSDPEREHLRAIGCDVDRVAVVPNGVSLGGADESTITRVPRLIYPGAVTYSANFDAVRFFVRDVFPIVQRERPDVEFWVTGSTQGIDTSELAVPGVRFTGRLPEVDSLVAGSAACVVPLRVGGGTRLKVLQAMARSTPIVSTTKGIEGLAVEPGRDVLVADSPAAFAAQTLRLLRDESLCRRLTASAYQLVQQRYAWQGIGETLERVIDEAVAERAASA